MSINPKREAAKTLYNTMFDELAEYNLSNYELHGLYQTLVVMSLISFVKGTHEKKGILNFVDSNSENCSKQKIEEACSGLYSSSIYSVLYNINKYSLRYFAHMMGRKSHLHHILKSFTEMYELPKSRQDIIDFLSNDYDHDKFSDYVHERIKVNDNGKIQWYLKTLSERQTFQVPNAVFVWPKSEGFFRFIDANGKWGFIDEHTLKITMLPDKIIEMNDFVNYRARVLVGDKANILIPADNHIFVDYHDTKYLYWNYVDMRGNFIDNKHYSSAEDFSGNTAKVSMSQESINWGFNKFEKGIPCPYDNMEIDLFGNFTDECTTRLNEALSEKDRNRFFSEMFGGGDDEDNIMDALEHGCGDIYGF